MRNPLYRDPAAIRKVWKTERSVALADFLDDRELSAIMRATNGASAGWKRSCVPDRHRYEEKRIALPEARAAVKAITGRLPLSGKSMRSGAGDYTILHDDDAQRPGVVALLFLEDWDGRWGGYIAFMREGETLHRFVPRRNTLLIVERKRGVRYFVKYVTHKAGKRRLRIVSA